MVQHSSNNDWLMSRHEDALEPDLPICDPHHHLWDKKAESYTQRRYLIDEMLDDLSGGHNIVSTVFIECGTMFREDGPDAMKPVGETEFVNGIAAMSASGEYGPTRIAKGIVGTVDLKLGDVSGDVLDAHMAAGGGRFRGIRLGAFWHADAAIPNHRTQPPEHMLLREDFRTGFKHLAPRNLTFEAWVSHPQIPDVTDLARAFPDTTIILNHFGGPAGIGPYAGKADDVFTDWCGKISELSKCPNVVVKLGGLNMAVNGYLWHQQATPPSSLELMEATRRYSEFAIEKFGVDRCMFESNFPVDKLSCSYTVLWNSFKRLTTDWAASDRAALFHDTAVRVYRL